MASIKQDPDTAAVETQPAAIYGTEGPIRLRIAAEEGTHTSLIEALANGFIKHSLQISPTFRSSPFRIALNTTHTAFAYNALANRSADVSITYHPYASLMAVAQGVVDRREYVWRDAFGLVGPKSNPANLPQNPDLSIYEFFALLFIAATEARGSSNNVRFLSTYDGSAKNVLESRIWTSIGQTPWNSQFTTWYHRYMYHPSVPADALLAATSRKEYTLVDRATWYFADQKTRDSLILFKEGSIDGHDTADESYENGESYGLNDDGLGSPAHCLLGWHAPYKEEGQMFLDWLVKEDGGRRVIRSITAEHGVQVYGLPPGPKLTPTAHGAAQIIDLS